MESFNVMVDTTQEFLHQAAAFMPRLALALLIVAFGWLIARAVRFGVERGLRAVNFNILTERAGTDHFLQHGGLRGDTTTVFGLLAFWIVFIAALMIAFNGLGASHVADLLQRVELFAPKIVVSGLILVLGSYFARFVGEAVDAYCARAQIADADLIGKIVRYIIMSFVLMIALSHLEIGGDFIQRVFLIILAGVVLAFALAFGLGGREWAAAMLERWWPQRKNSNDRPL
jgi:hypothetical protein